MVFAASSMEVSQMAMLLMHLSYLFIGTGFSLVFDGGSAEVVGERDAVDHWEAQFLGELVHPRLQLVLVLEVLAVVTHYNPTSLLLKRAPTTLVSALNFSTGSTLICPTAPLLLSPGQASSGSQAPLFRTPESCILQSVDNCDSVKN